MDNITPQIINNQLNDKLNNKPQDKSIVPADSVETLEEYKLSEIQPTKRTRRVKLTPRFIKKAQQLLMLGNKDKVVCDILNVKIGTYYKWLRIGREIEDQLIKVYGDDTDFTPEERVEAILSLGRDHDDVLRYDLAAMHKQATGMSIAGLITVLQQAAITDPYIALKLLPMLQPELYGSKQKIVVTSANPLDQEEEEKDFDLSLRDKLLRAERLNRLLKGEE